MSERKKGILINFVLGLILAVVVIFIKWPVEKTTEIVDGVEKSCWSWYPEISLFHKLSDGFFVSGVLIFGIGALKFFRNKGTFDILSYGVSSVIYTAIPMLDRRKPERRNEDFYGYTQRKQEERKPASELLIAGGVYLALAALMLVLYSITA